MIIILQGKKDINNMHAMIVGNLKDMLDDNNVLVKSFRMAKERVLDNGQTEIRLSLIGRREGDAGRYNLPTVSKVATLVVVDFDQAVANRDKIVETQIGQLQWINELNTAYLRLQYPMPFHLGEDDYRENIPYVEKWEIIEYERVVCL